MRCVCARRIRQIDQRAGEYKIRTAEGRDVVGWLAKTTVATGESLVSIGAGKKRAKSTVIQKLREKKNKIKRTSLR